MEGVTAATRAAERILEEKGVLAREITDALYEQMPELLEKHGEYGRKKCLQDMHYNLEHLAPAVDLGQPEMFAGYARWLSGLLAARNVSTAEVARSLELTETRIRERFTAEEAEAVVSSIRAGLAELSGEENPR
jgi:hypothetical protein